MDVNPIVAAYVEAMRQLLDDPTDRRRFLKLGKLCSQADNLARISAESEPSSFDENPDEWLINGQNLQPAFGRMGGEAQDLLREIVPLLGPLFESQSRRTRAEADREVAASLVELCRAREQLAGQKLGTLEIDDKINQLREEIVHARQVVPTVVLRGREAVQSGREDHPRGLGETDER